VHEYVWNLHRSKVDHSKLESRILSTLILSIQISLLDAFLLLPTKATLLQGYFLRQFLSLSQSLQALQGFSTTYLDTSSLAFEGLLVEKNLWSLLQHCSHFYSCTLSSWPNNSHRINLK
jgi:hypothetical protein